MTKFANSRFSVHYGGDAYSSKWERIFGKKKAPTCARCRDTGFYESNTDGMICDRYCDCPAASKAQEEEK